jgi:hypothetical protein
MAEDGSLSDPGRRGRAPHHHRVLEQIRPRSDVHRAGHAPDGDARGHADPVPGRTVTEHDRRAGHLVAKKIRGLARWSDDHRGSSNLGTMQSYHPRSAYARQKPPAGVPVPMAIGARA